MIELQRGYRLPSHLLAIALFVASYSADLRGQSLQTTPAPELEVLSAHYNRVREIIQFKLGNNSQKAATAYFVAFGVRGEKDEKYVNWESGYSEDLLDQVLTSQCRYASANSLEGDDTWEGAIKSGDVYVHSGGTLPKDQLWGVNPVQGAVVGVVWSDGSVETRTMNGMTYWVKAAMNNLLDQRKEDARESSKVVAILNAHPEDADIQHRIGEARKSLQMLMDEYRREQAEASREQMHHDSMYLVSRVLNTLNNFVALSKPKAPFDYYKAVFECQSKRRVALAEAISPGPPEQ